MPVAANLSYTFNGLTPVSITQRAPYTVGDPRPRWRRLRTGSLDDRAADAQSRRAVGLLSARITRRRRWDPTLYTPTRNVTFPAGDLASLNDVTPKLGVAYDLFGNGRTALKASLSKYVEQLTYTGTYGDSANPTQRTVQAVTRQWNDIDHGLHTRLRSHQPAAERRVPPDQQPRLR